MVALLGFLLVNCQKDEDQKQAPQQSANAEIESLQRKAATDSVDMHYLIATVNDIVEKGILSKGQVQSLLSKVNSTTSPVERGNTITLIDRLEALKTEVGHLIENGTLTPEQGQLFIKEAEFAINFPQRNFIDARDRRQYTVVLLGDQIWMAQNLKATKFLNGDEIANVTDNFIWGTTTTSAYCNYNNDFATVDIYGKLYNFYTVVDNRKLCPIGWHVPSDAEWTTLTTFLGGESVSGGKLKETGTSHWVNPNTAATNKTGITALPGGYRYVVDGTFNNFGYLGYWWSSTENSKTLAWYRYMDYHTSGVYRYNYGYPKQDGFSVRCLWD